MPQMLIRKNSKGIADYTMLRERVKETLILGQRRIEREKVRTYWETGRLIIKHTLAYKERADYGSYVMSRLSRDLGVSRSLLHRVVQFAESFPIVAARRQLSWTHYRTRVSE